MRYRIVINEEESYFEVVDTLSIVKDEDNDDSFVIVAKAFSLEVAEKIAEFFCAEPVAVEMD